MKKKYNREDLLVGHDVYHDYFVQYKKGGILLNGFKTQEAAEEAKKQLIEKEGEK